MTQKQANAGFFPLASLGAAAVGAASYFAALIVLRFTHGAQDVAGLPGLLLAMGLWSILGLAIVVGTLAGVAGLLSRQGQGRPVVALALGLNLLVAFAAYRSWLQKPVNEHLDKIEQMDVESGARPVTPQRKRRYLEQALHASAGTLPMAMKSCSMSSRDGNRPCAEASGKGSIGWSNNQLGVTVDIRIGAVPVKFVGIVTVANPADGFSCKLKSSTGQAIHDAEFRFAPDDLAGDFAFSMPKTPGRPGTSYDLRFELIPK